MYWTLTITRLSGSLLGMDKLIGAITALLRARGQQGFDFTLSYQRRAGSNTAACPECGAQAGLHAISCESYQPTADDPEHLSDVQLEELRAIPPFQSYEWLTDEALPAVELRQDQLEALITEVNSWRRGE
jgi:hypothetical protein